VILKGEKIAQKMQLPPESGKQLIIEPRPDLNELKESGSASIDLRLGTWFVTLRETKIPYLNIRDTPPPPERQLTKTHYRRFGDKFILHPRCFVLGVSLEWVRFPKDLASYVIGKSSWGRRGLIIATATGVHPGFTGCLTLELTNVGEIPIALIPGMQICQLFIHEVECDSDSTDKTPLMGQRKPLLGEIALDEIAQKLSNAGNT
jgi:dCTP deaminase